MKRTSKGVTVRPKTDPNRPARTFNHPARDSSMMAAASPVIRPLAGLRRAALIFAWALAGCGGPDAEAPGAKSGGSDNPLVVVDGSSTVYRISKAAQEDFDAVDAKVEVTVGNSGTGGGFTKYLANEIDIVDASRPAKKEEEAKAKEQGLNWDRYLVGYDGITVIVNPKNDFVKELSVAQLKRIWEPESKVKTWKDLDPSWPDREIKLYSPDDKSGTFEFFTEAVNGKAKSQRKDVQQSADDNTLVIGVGGDPDGIGYFGYAYFKENEAKLRAIPIRKAPYAPAVMPSPETILSKEYSPLARPLYIYVKRSSFRREAVAKFVRYYLDHIAELAVKAKYVAPTGEDVKANKATLDAAGVVTPSA